MFLFIDFTFFAILFRSLIAPVSLLTCTIETKVTLSFVLIKSYNFSSLTEPSLFKSINSVVIPLFLSSLKDLKTAECSPLDVTKTPLFTVQKMAWLSASDPHEI